MTVVGELKQASKVACLQAVDVLQRRNPLGLKALSWGGCRELGEAVCLRAPCVTSPRNSWHSPRNRKRQLTCAALLFTAL